MTGDVHNEHFDAWDGAAPGATLWGAVREITDPVGDSRIFAYRHTPNSDENRAVIGNDGACFGFVQSGRVLVSDPQVDWSLHRGQWFATRGSVRLDFDTTAPETRVVVVQRVGYRGLQMAGGPIEVRGRLRYIDRCSDTLLAGPPRLGDPCLNLLHFPPAIDQTFHVHPSVRAGIVARGQGWCETPHGRSSLHAGVFFSIPANGVHRFITESDSGMDVIAYHPDSDWGPTDEQHPMLNRTWDPETREALDHDPTASIESGRIDAC